MIAIRDSSLALLATIDEDNITEAVVDEILNADYTLAFEVPVNPDALAVDTVTPAWKTLTTDNVADIGNDQIFDIVRVERFRDQSGRSVVRVLAESVAYRLQDVEFSEAQEYTGFVVSRTGAEIFVDGIEAGDLAAGDLVAVDPYDPWTVASIDAVANSITLTEDPGVDLVPGTAIYKTFRFVDYTPSQIMTRLTADTTLTFDVSAIPVTTETFYWQRETGRSALLDVLDTFNADLEMSGTILVITPLRGDPEGAEIRYALNIASIRVIADDRHNEPASYEIEIAELAELPTPLPQYALDLGDAVHLVDEELDYDETSRVIRYEWDMKEPERSRITLGARRRSMGDVIREIKEDIDQQGVERRSERRETWTLEIEEPDFEADVPEPFRDSAYVDPPGIGEGYPYEEVLPFGTEAEIRAYPVTTNFRKFLVWFGSASEAVEYERLIDDGEGGVLVNPDVVYDRDAAGDFWAIRITTTRAWRVKVQAVFSPQFIIQIEPPEILYTEPDALVSTQMTDYQQEFNAMLVAHYSTGGRWDPLWAFPADDEPVKCSHVDRRDKVVLRSTSGGAWRVEGYDVWDDVLAMDDPGLISYPSGGGLEFPAQTGTPDPLRPVTHIRPRYGRVTAARITVHWLGHTFDVSGTVNVSEDGPAVVFLRILTRGIGSGPWTRASLTGNAVIGTGNDWPAQAAVDTEYTQELIFPLAEWVSTGSDDGYARYHRSFRQVEDPPYNYLDFDSVTIQDDPVGTVKIWRAPFASGIPVGWSLASDINGRVLVPWTSEDDTNDWLEAVGSVEGDYRIRRMIFIQRTAVPD